MSSLIPAVIVPAFIPSPSQGVWHLLGLPIRAYALCILAGIFIGYWLTRRRWVARGGSPTVLSDVMFWAIPFGLVGARIYHVATDAELYFGEGRHPIDALKIWHGGLGIWGAVGFGALGAYLACRRAKVPFLAFLDAVAPGIALAQVFGRFGNYFNQELFGKPTTRPWGLEIDPAHRPEGFTDFATFHPTFLYEAIWNLGVMALVILVGRRITLGYGRAFFLYVAAYCAGRAWIENMRIDTVNHFLGLRLNVWTSIILFVLAVVALIISFRTKPGQQDISTGPAAGVPDEEAAGTTDAEPEAAPVDADAVAESVVVENADPASEVPAPTGELTSTEAAEAAESTEAAKDTDTTKPAVPSDGARD
ncbi:prolipoprotein diacylglyceryl transferase [Kribbella antibiotica]|uniref:Phosphatidylglycerol--prolipoprotein diacylglyceryl transferase n=1 Tax=Kribbella antibiotica TaxID=190195 RepID=A0A4V2YMA5_9ACTN|nr:prolipoprotein diacylglyceryl transferase [Kribbella antibiotica]TDD49857.1 prolipoprotein diacylglyceryl transferase [Kribbella antibiotica]